MSGQPPSYDTAVTNPAHNPALKVTDPTGHTNSQASLGNSVSTNGLTRSTSATSYASVDTVSSVGSPERLVDDDGLRELDDEMRELPKGWVRCFDPK